jgi:hypothetical protein
MSVKVVHCKRDKYDVYIGRPSEWGNPFSHKEGTLAKFRVATVQDAVSGYEEWLLTQPQLLAKLPLLKGKVLGCWCKFRGTEPCHGDILIRLANKE